MIGLFFMLLSVTAVAAIDAYSFPNNELRNRYNSLIAELRCPQCLNTNLAGSDSMVAKDLRNAVHRLLLEGKSDDEIKGFMLERYGDFILYDPQLKKETWLLWFGPLFLLMIAGFVAFRVSRPRELVALSADEETQIEQILKTVDKK